jgi:hypothetical protein
MRYVKKNLTDIPPLLVSQQAKDDIEKIAKKDASVSILDKIYKGEYKDAEGKSQSQVRDYLNKYYHRKCAYCEQTCKAEIEHYRPKKGVIEDNTHDGYYWLCYTWSNLLPSCRYCNTEGGKGNKFPIINAAKRVKSPSFNSSKLDQTKCQARKSPLIDEEPFLIHPEVDNDPEFFFSFKISDDKNGMTIIGIDTYQRGTKTIDICNLNRNDLRQNRLEAVCFHMKQKIKIIFDLNATNVIPNNIVGDALIEVYKELEKESKNELLTHTLLRKYLISSTQNFENHFAPYLETDAERSIAVQAFKKFKSKVVE